MLLKVRQGYDGPWWWASGQRARLLLDDPSSNPADAYSFFCKFVFEKNENKQKETGGWPIFKNMVTIDRFNKF